LQTVKWQGPTTSSHSALANAPASDSASCKASASYSYPASYNTSTSQPICRRSVLTQHALRCPWTHSLLHLHQEILSLCIPIECLPKFCNSMPNMYITVIAITAKSCEWTTCNIYTYI
jgi:hypothetical protein